ncbi:MAG: T9SS C-terminal target domain-containing protein [Balneola sp.]|nr:MAG: T9SS C-terminal target domain-containing protein [Balneola sp.]
MNVIKQNTFHSPLITESNRRARSLYRWLSRVAGLKACWVEGIDEDNQPLWGFIKRVTKNKFAVFSRRLTLASLLLTPLLLSSQVTAQTSIDLSELDGTTGTTFIGIASSFSYSYSGRSIATGDINGDGISDLIIGAAYADENITIRNSGRTYIVFGQSTTFGSSFELSSVDGSNGFRLNGIDTNDRSGYAVASGDVNGDGIDDVITSAHFADPNDFSSGETYVVFGQSSFSGASSIDLSSLDGTTGFTLNGVGGDDASGSALASGDINGDGMDDVIIGANSADPNGSASGETYVIFGQSSFSGASSIELSSLDGTTGFTLNGIDTNDESGHALASGDVNGDGIDDVIIGAYKADPNGNTDAGETYVVFGQSSFSGSSSIELSSLDGTTGFVLNGSDTGSQSGGAVTSGDINGDGITDVIVGAITASPNGTTGGATYVVFGQTTFASSFEISSLDGISGFTLNGIDTGDRSGYAVAFGDVNGDGIGDVITSAHLADPNGSSSGESYVVFGDTATFSSSIDLSSLDGDIGFALNGEFIYGYGTYSGHSLTSGDINGDGFDDIAIGAPGYQNSGYGKTHVFFNSISETVTGDEGFRTLAAPSNGTVFDELLGGFWTQGFTGADSLVGSANVWTWDQATQGWAALTDQETNSLSAGNGFLFYIFSDDNGLKTSGDAGFPKYIAANQFGGDGSVNSGSVTPVSDLADSDFFFAGNPYFYPIDWDLLTKSGLSETVYIYDDANSTWQTWNGSTGNITDGELSAFQGFFIEGFGGSGSLTIEEADITSNSVSLLKTVTTDPKALKIHAEAGSFSADAWLSFQEGGELGRDAFDGLSLTPLSSSYLRLTTIIENDDQLQINALPVDYGEELRFPLDLSGIVDSSFAQVSFEGLEDFDDWEISIKDLETEEVFELSQDDTLSLAIRSVAAKALGAPGSPVTLKAKATETGHRFELVLTPVIGVTNTQPDPSLPEQITLAQNYPNPFNPGTRILFEVPRAGRVSLEVFNLVGQKVAQLVDEQKPAGRYEVTFDASSLSSGVYVYRLTTGGQQLTRKMTLIK